MRARFFVFYHLCALFYYVARVFNILRALLLLRWRVWRVNLVHFAPMSLQAFRVGECNVAAQKCALLRRLVAHLLKRLRQRNSAILGFLGKLCKTAFDGSRCTWFRNDACQLLCVFFRLVAKFEAARARNRFFSVEFLHVAVLIVNFRKGFWTMRARDDAFVRKFRVVFERTLAEKRRSIAFGANEAAMRLFVRDQLFFRLEYQLALLARKFRFASLNVRVVLHLRRKYEIAIFARCRDRRVT